MLHPASDSGCFLIMGTILCSFGFDQWYTCRYNNMLNPYLKLHPCNKNRSGQLQVWWEEGHPPCSWARTNGYGLITGFGDGLLNLAKVNVCALTVGSRQQDGWPRLGLVRIILYGKMFTHLPKQLQSLHNRGRHWRKTLMVLERQHYPEEHKAFLGTKFYYL